jgi:hypothetical protein
MKEVRAMEFKHEVMQYQDVWISGIYKCVKYGQWVAFFKPAGWPNWGNSCERTNFESSRKYKSLKGAMAACKRHARKFPNHPEAHQKIFV